MKRPSANVKGFRATRAGEVLGMARVTRSSIGERANHFRNLTWLELSCRFDTILMRV